MVKEEVSVNKENYDKTKEKENKEKNTYRTVKMEEFQKRIDELKEKLKIEEGHLHDAEKKLTTDMDDCKFDYSPSDSSKNVDVSSDEKDCSEDSFYFSASNHSMCSFKSDSTATTYYNFAAFVNNFVQSQTPEERLSLLQLHSKTQITLNMMKHSLVELDSRCSKELELVQTSLQQLDRLAKEYNVDVGSVKYYDDYKAMELPSLSDAESEKSKADGSSENIILKWKNSKPLSTYEESNNSSNDS